MVSANGRESSAFRAIRSFLERTMERIDEHGDELTSADLRDIRDDAHTALLKMETEDLDPMVRVIRPADIEKLEGDDRGCLVFLKGQDGATGPILIVQPSVLLAAVDVLKRARLIQ